MLLLITGLVVPVDKDGVVVVPLVEVVAVEVIVTVGSWNVGKLLLM